MTAEQEKLFNYCSWPGAHKYSCHDWTVTNQGIVHRNTAIPVTMQEMKL